MFHVTAGRIEIHAMSPPQLLSTFLTSDVGMVAWPPLLSTASATFTVRVARPKAESVDLRAASPDFAWQWVTALGLATGQLETPEQPAPPVVVPQVTPVVQPPTPTNADPPGPPSPVPVSAAASPVAAAASPAMSPAITGTDAEVRMTTAALPPWTADQSDANDDEGGYGSDGDEQHDGFDGDDYHEVEFPDNSASAGAVEGQLSPSRTPSPQSRQVLPSLSACMSTLGCGCVCVRPRVCRGCMSDWLPVPMGATGLPLCS